MTDWPAQLAEHEAQFDDAEEDRLGEPPLALDWLREPRVSVFWIIFNWLATRIYRLIRKLSGEDPRG